MHGNTACKQICLKPPDSGHELSWLLATEGLIEAITRAEDGEDVDIADLVDQFSEVRKRVA